MPKNKIFFTNIKFTAKDPIMPCEFCDFTSTSITAIKLHRKARHNENTKYETENRIHVEFCMGCKKKMKKCICYK